jgi:LDH2 family malate/lactate/ureidoglycolate dehydrogenase
MEIAIAELETIADNILGNMGYDSRETAAIRDVLFYAELRGNSQGLVKLITGGIGPNAATGPAIIKRETPVSAIVDANQTHAMVAMQTCLEKVREKTAAIGIGLVGLHNATPSTGAIGYYVRTLANDGLIGIMMASSPAYVAVEGGRTPVIGTNPIAFGIPAKPEPIVFDMATAAIAYYAVHLANETGNDLPAGVALDGQGHPTINPAQALNGAIKTFGGAKGSGLGLMVEILAGPLIGAGFCGLGEDQYGQLLIAINPTIFSEKTDFENHVSNLVSHVKNAPLAPGIEMIHLPGESSSKRAQKAIKTGFISIDGAILQKLKEMAK